MAEVIHPGTEDPEDDKPYSFPTRLSTDPRGHETGYSVAWHGLRGRPRIGAASPSISLTRSPMSTSDCDAGVVGGERTF